MSTVTVTISGSMHLVIFAKLDSYKVQKDAFDLKITNLKKLNE